MAGLEQFQQRISNSWASLGQRDRMALLIMAAFLSVAALGSLLWYPHKAALKQQQRLNDLTSTLQWMQSNAAQLPSSPSQDATPLAKVQRIAQQNGLNVQVDDMQGQIKVATQHQQYGILANFITQLTAQGMSIITMSMQKQADGTIRLLLTLQ